MKNDTKKPRIENLDGLLKALEEVVYRIPLNDGGDISYEIGGNCPANADDEYDILAINGLTRENGVYHWSEITVKRPDGKYTSLLLSLKVIDEDNADYNKTIEI